IKHHLAGTKKDVSACDKVGPEVKKQMWDIVVGLQANLIKKLNPPKKKLPKMTITMIKRWKGCQIL
ncbi:hypothetical protein PIB30_041010, partial [Stylosanthes scabra]|nr:hypothetical protein [Stylosanthes scabra]